MMPDSSAEDLATYAAVRQPKQTLYLRFFGQGALRAVAIAVVDEFERAGARWSEWRVYLGGVPRESEPYSWGDPITRGDLDGPLTQVLDWGTKLWPEAAREMFPRVEGRHPGVRWAE